jgi:hypothetical protein
MRKFINVYTIGFAERFVNSCLEARPCFLMELRLRTRPSVGRKTPPIFTVMGTTHIPWPPLPAVFTLGLKTAIIRAL